jgi:hypothetical protein
VSEQPEFDMDLIERALREADDALGCLRRGFGLDVTEYCYPARNSVLEAVEHIALVKACRE